MRNRHRDHVKNYPHEEKYITTSKKHVISTDEREYNNLQYLQKKNGGRLYIYSGAPEPKQKRAEKNKTQQNYFTQTEQ